MKIFRLTICILRYARLISAVDTDEYASNCEYWVKTEGQDPLDSTGSIWEEYTTDRKELEKKIIEQVRIEHVR